MKPRPPIYKLKDTKNDISRTTTTPVASPYDKSRRLVATTVLPRDKSTLTYHLGPTLTQTLQTSSLFSVDACEALQDDFLILFWALKPNMQVRF